MALAYEWEGFIRIHGGEAGARDMFEKAMDALLRAENPCCKEVHIVKASQGDGGIDVYVHQEDGIDIYQCKFFMGSMTSGRWSQIRESFDRAMEPKGVKVLRWVLCMPREMQKEDIGKWDEFKKDRAPHGVEIQLVDGNEIVARMRECDRSLGTDLIESFFGKARGAVIPKCLTRYVPPHLEIDLVGRDEIIEKVRAILDQSTHIALVSGLGGIGKTAVMQNVCESIRYDGNSENHVAWITCGENLEEDLLALREGLGVPKGASKKEAYDVVIQELKTFPGTLYLFMDDMARIPSAAERGNLAALGPNVRIMITSRHEIPGIDKRNKVDLKVLARDDAIEMFYGYYQRDEERKYVEDVWGIIESESVKRHTLLVELLAKAANRRSFDTLDEFRMDLEKLGFFDVSKAKLSSGHDENLTIEESVIKLYEISRLSPEQKRIMSLFTIFTPEKVIYGKVIEWAGFDENDVEELVRLGWISKTDGGFVIHQIVKDSIARQIENNLCLDEYGNLLRNVIKVRSYMPVVIGYTKIRERLVFTCDVAGCIERRTWRTLEINKWLEKDVALLKYSYALFNNLAGVYISQGDYVKALEYYEKALVIIRRVVGSDHSDTAKVFNNIGLVYQEKGNYVKALEYYEKALKIKEHELGTDPLSKATTFNNIADVYRLQGNYEKALVYYEKSLSIKERELGTDHLSTANSYNNMAVVLYKKGYYEKALDYFEKALETKERVLGTSHPHTATTYNNMGLVYRAKQNYEKALECNMKALNVIETVVGTDHPDTATIYNNIAYVFHAKGDYEKALEYFEKALSVRNVKLGANHPYTKRTKRSVEIVKSLIENRYDKD